MSQSYREMVERARAVISEVMPEEVAQQSGSYLLVDVREPKEHVRGAIEGSVLVPLGSLQDAIGGVAADTSTEIILYCAAGQRSALGALALEQMGYENVSSMAGGFSLWHAQGLPWVVPESAPKQQSARYARHITLPGVGIEGQQRLLEASVLIVGAGGLGSPAALYLTAAGVGRIGVVDDDIVDVSNLQRQVLHHTGAVGASKVDSAVAALHRLNPDVVVEGQRARLDASNAVDVMAGHDVVIDGADNFPTRYLINDASMHVRVPVVHGSIYRFEGQATVFSPYVGPCYRCLFPTPPPPELAPNCAEAGVLGVLPGVMGSIQATEAIKLILGIGEPLIGRLLLYDALVQEMTTLNVSRDPECPACGDERNPPQVVDYDDSCLPAGP